jgi:predicted nucleic-acid-binding Zn-ribbon protein
MTKTENCLKCNSTKIIPRARIVDRANYNAATDLMIHVYESPDALIFKRKHEGQLSARICGDCGYVETYVDNHAELYEAFLNRESE